MTRRKKLIHKPAPARRSRLCVSGRHEFIDLVAKYVAKKKISVTALEYAALGNHGVLSRCMSRPDYRVSLQTVETVIEYIRENR